jgi:hypothetical protein
MAAITAVGGTKVEGMTVADMTEDHMEGIGMTDIAANHSHDQPGSGR